MRETEKKILEIAGRHKELYQEAVSKVVQEIKNEHTTYDEAIKALKGSKVISSAQTSEEKSFIHHVTNEAVRKLYEEAYSRNMKSGVK